MSTRLVILASLRDQPLHGYEIKQIIEEHMGDWTNIAFGSIYFALGKLAEEGMIEKIATEKEGNRPSRITEGSPFPERGGVWGEVKRNIGGLTGFTQFRAKR